MYWVTWLKYWFYRIKGLFIKNKASVKLTNEERMNITDPDWRTDKKIKKSYFWVGLIILMLCFGLLFLLVGANLLGCTVMDLIHKILHHMVPEVQDPDSKDLMR